jgi:hypothetical protein
LIDGSVPLSGQALFISTPAPRRISPHSSTAARAAIALSLLFAAAPARGADAIPPPAGDAAVLAQIGDRARLAGRFAEAEASYRASLALAHDDAIALSLALALAAQGKALEAAPLLARAARATSTLSGEARERAERALIDAQRELATVTVKTSAGGAAVDVDGVPAGTTPLPEPLFLGLGPHTVRARRDGHRAAEAAFEAEAGRSYSVELELLADGARGPAGAAQGERRAGAEGPAALRAEDLLLGAGGAVRASGVVLTAAALVGGFASLAVAESSRARVVTHEQELDGDVATSCIQTGSEPLPRTCVLLREAHADLDKAAAATAVLFVGAGVSAAATLLSIFVLPPPARLSRGGGLDFTLSAVAGLGGGGVSLEASW